MSKKRKKRHRIKTLGCLSILAVLAIIILIASGCRYLTSYAQTLWESNVSGVLTSAVMDYEPTVRQYARENDIEPYTDILLAMMMQESKGIGSDPMQSSESTHNTVYEKEPGAIEDPDYSIMVGVRYFSDALDLAECKGPEDLSRLELAIQGYNFGNGYISWARERNEGYTEENARIFSNAMKAELGWDVYGDPEYANKVMRYYEQIQSNED
ncbi:lysozyme family protein [Eubacterium barkeri]|uniref:Lysozyme-like n=1 Tax=Eubacterium barkeri TaxID=1528 RepID=A0A1H3BEC1_EUBBA|nr:lysozyme family protein [Eubacterium barkeri]SDX40135.1 Lysozyme-like [Eubacterium barkeri]